MNVPWDGVWARHTRSRRAPLGIMSILDTEGDLDCPLVPALTLGKCCRNRRRRSTFCETEGPRLVTDVVLA